MVSYGDWLDQLDNKLDQVDQGCAELLSSVDSLLVIARTWVGSCDAFSSTAASLISPTSSTAASLNHIGAAQIDLCDLYGDFQVVINWDWILAEGGIDPNKLFEPITSGYGGAANFEVRQSARLVLLSGPAITGNPTPVGHTGLQIPIGVTLLGTSHATDLYVAADLVCQPGPSQVVLAVISSPLRVKSSLGLAATARWTIENQASAPIAAALASTVVLLPPITLLPTQPHLWSAWHDGSARLAGQVKKRSRRRQGFVPPSPGGFPIGVRLQLEVIINEIAVQVSAMGVSLFAGPTVVGPKTFTLTAGVEFRKEVKLGPKSFAKARVKIWQDFRGELTIFGSRLFINVNPVGNPGTDVSIEPDIPLLTSWVEGIIEDFIKSKIPTIAGISRTYNLSGISSFDVWLSTDFITLGIVPS